MARTKKTDTIVDDILATEKPTTKKEKAKTEKTEKVEKTTADTDKTVDAEKENLKEQNKQMAEMLKQMQAQIEQLKAESNKVQVIQTVGSSGKKVKVINLTHCPVSVSTEGDGQGIVKTFNKYGDVLTIKFDVLSDMVANYQNTFSRGYLRILDKDVVDELSLTDEYEELYTKEMIDEIINLQTDGAVDLFVNMDDTLRETTARTIAMNLKNGQVYDFNRLHRIQKETGIDIEKLSENENLTVTI